jgi:urease accessory protein UreH
MTVWLPASRSLTVGCQIQLEPEASIISSCQSLTLVYPTPYSCKIECSYHITVKANSKLQLLVVN